MAKQQDKNIHMAPVMIPGRWLRSVTSASLSLNFLLFFLVVGLLLWNPYQDQPEPKYFAATEDNRFIELQPKDRATESKPGISQWAVDAIAETYDWNFRNYKTRTEHNCHKYFTDNGCVTYKNSLIQMGILDYVTNNKLLVTANIVETPIIVEHGLNKHNVYTWKLEMPAIVTYESSTQRKAQAELFTILVTRVGNDKKPRGIAIDKFKSSPYKDL